MNGAVFLYKRAILSFGGNSTAFGTSFVENHWFLLKSAYFVDFHQVRSFFRAETWTRRGVRALDSRSGLIASRNDPQRSSGRNTGGLRALARSLAGVT